MLVGYTDEEGGMVYPATAEHLVFRKGLTFSSLNQWWPIIIVAGWALLGAFVGLAVIEAVFCNLPHTGVAGL